jgi:phosphatidylinositol alpha-1,6-mannosyltransferase
MRAAPARTLVQPPLTERLRRTIGAPLRRMPAHLGVALACLVCALGAAGTALVTGEAPQRLWGWWAAAGYLVAGAVAIATRRSALAVRIAVAGSVLLPALVLVAGGISQPEVGVIERSAQLLVDTGSPYSAHPVTTYDVNPYLPAMSLFGLPRAVLGATGLGDPRWWFLVVFAACFLAADRIVGRRRGGELVLWVLLACPFVAVQAVAAGDDLPVVGLLCLAIALAADGREAQAGLVLGIASALKASAWPAVVVVAVLVVARFGWRRAARLGTNAVAVLVGVTLPVLVGPTGRAMIAQAAGFPMAQDSLKSPADAPTPGVLLANGGPMLRLAGDALLLLTVLALCTWLTTRPPRTAFRAAGAAAVALTAAALVLPTSRFGYVVYPIVFTVFALRARRVPARPDPTEPLLPALHVPVLGGNGPRSVEARQPGSGSDLRVPRS